MQQDLKSKETQDLIINKSFELFYSQGYNKTSIPDIMKQTSLSKGAFYHHFKNKNDIGKKIINGIIKNKIYNGFINPLKDYKNKNIPDLILYVFTQRIKNYTEKEKQLGCPANNLINEIGCNESDFRILLRDLIDSWVDTLANTIQEGIRKKEIHSEVNPRALAICLIGSFEGIRGIRKIYDDDIVFDNYMIGIKTYINNISI
tara:strand:+ start:68 stop:676 length:609 start_codon:yes stop_codon:yes gene_type:complete